MVALYQVPNQNGRLRTALNLAGTGVLTPLDSISIGRPAPQAMTPGRMDLNTSTDLAIATPNYVVILNNDGAGNYGGHIATVSFGATGSRDIAVGELDGNPGTDIVVSNTDGGGSLEPLFSNSGTSWGSPGLQSIGMTLTNLQLVDLDGDHDLDVVGIGDDGKLHTRINDGANHFTAGATLAIGANPRALVATDLDGDGDTDLVAIVDPSSVVVVTNTNTTLIAGTPIPVGGTAFGLAVGDVDGDGDLDLVVSDGAADRVFVLRRDAGTFLAPMPLTVGTSPREIAVADLDGDAIDDIVVLLADGQLVTLLSNP